MRRMRMLYLLVIIAALLAVPALAELRPNVIVSGYEITAGTVAPGQEFTLALTLRNTEPSTCAKAVTATVQTASPFILRGAATFAAADLCKGDEATIEVPMRIDPAATGGSYQLTIATTYESSTLIQFSGTGGVTILVAGSPLLDAFIVGSQPVEVYPGDTAAVDITIENSGDFAARSVTGTLSSENAVEVIPAGSFASYGSIAAKGTGTATFTVDVPKDAASGDYPLTFHFTYQDENLEVQVKDIMLTFHVKERAKYDAVDAGTEALYANQNDRLVKLTLTNTGTAVANKLRVKILPQYPFSTDGSVRYVESLAPGESAPVEFTVDIDKDGTPGKYGLDLLVQFEDVQGKAFQETATFPLVVASTGLFRGVFLNYWYLWSVVLVVVAIVVSKRLKA